MTTDGTDESELCVRPIALVKMACGGSGPR